MTELDARLAEHLLRAGRLDRASLDRAMRLQAASGGGLQVASGERLDALLAKLGMVAERELAAALAELLGLRLAAPDDYPAEPVLDLPPQFLRTARALPLRLDGPVVELALADPLDAFTVDAVRLASGLEVRVAVAVPAELEAALERLFGGAQPAAEPADASAEAEDVERLKDLASEAPVIRLVNTLIARAVEARASDIHLEPFEGRLRVRLRVDGRLMAVEEPPASLRAAVVSRLKIMARLDIAERRLPQDGRIKLAVRGRELDFRVSTVPSLHGETVVLRVLDRQAAALDFAALGYGGAVLERFQGLLERPNGVVLVTGPTGSGKTTTLYAGLVGLNDAARKIVTVEDPVEYQLDGITQIQVKPQIGLDFAAVLRSVLRQDPDVIMVGEIRDRETAEIAVQAALTGHLVLSTLHTNSAATTPGRLLDMGVEPYLLTASVAGIAAQRLVRRLCPNCRRREDAPPPVAERFGLEALWRPVGCAACGGTGFRGRTGVVEVMAMAEPVRRLILARADAADIRRAAGVSTMLDDGLSKVRAGETALEEVLRAVREE